jgi:hypothetical protein
MGRASREKRDIEGVKDACAMLRRKVYHFAELPLHNDSNSSHAYVNDFFTLLRRNHHDMLKESEHG